MWNAAKIGLSALLSSKKAWIAVTSAIAAGAMRLGWNIDANTVGLVLAPLLTAIVGQAAVDVSKAKAPVVADAFLDPKGRG